MVRKASNKGTVDQVESLRVALNEKISFKDKVGVIYCFGANSVPADFLKKICSELQVAKKRKQCPPYLINLLDLCLPASKRDLRK